jgi:thiamine pyrophosphokinase
MLTNEVVILADGQFPEHTIPLNLLRSGRSIVCCDGAAMKLEAYGLEPALVIGDLDSLTENVKVKYADRLVYVPDQEHNDLTKAVHYCIEHGIEKVYILGATGLREDHALGNISLITTYAPHIKVEMHTNSGMFVPVLKTARLTSFAGQQISIFSLTPEVKLTFHNLKFPVVKRPLLSWWEGTLNEALGDWFQIEFTDGVLVVFLLYEQVYSAL